MVPALLNRTTVALLICLLSFSLNAEIYKYKDKNGRWQFTDRPVNADGTPITSYQLKAQKSNTGADKQPSLKADLEKLLHQRFRPTSKIDEATLAVVTVQTQVGSGSGFFITDDGFLVTNRHVVRPTTSTGWQQAESALQERKEQMEDYEFRLKEDEQTLKNMEQSINENRQYMNSGNARKSEVERYNRYLEKYERFKDRHRQNEKKFRAMNKEYKRAQSEFGFADSVSSFSKNFTIILKDGNKLSARLVKVSKNYDLALLKLDKYKTPYLSLSKNLRPRQGIKVFAIGSPLGISDSLTTGIVTKSGQDQIFTDAQILPGNSGGPLVDSEGVVLGVNTAILSQNRTTDGLGLALYSQFIKKEFGNNLPGNL